MEYFSSLLAALRKERDFDRKASIERVETMNLAERRANGFTWYPVVVKGTELGRGDYLEIELERTSHLDIIHQFRTGVAVALFSNADPKSDRIEGVVVRAGQNSLFVSFRTDELPDWADDGKLGADLLFDQTSYEEMEKTLKLAAQLDGKEAQNPLIGVFTGAKKPGFASLRIEIEGSHLNISQRTAVEKILSANQLAIVHGPPGTGKTTVLTNAIEQLVKNEGRTVLVTAPSNTAVDLLSERLSAMGLKVVRIGNPSRVDDRINSLTLDSMMASHQAIREVRRLKKQANEYRLLAGKYKRNFGREEREQRKALFQEARNLNKEIERTEQYILDSILGSADVIAATLVGANHYTIRQLRFETIFIDEAGQALEPAAWIPILKAGKVVMAGDHCQLPPTVKSAEALQLGLGISLMEKLVAMHPEAVVMLEEQYRMHEKIMEFPSREFYDDRLTAAPKVAGWLNFSGDEPFLFIDTAGCGFEEKREDKSIYNPEEGALLCRHLETYLALLTGEGREGCFPSVGIMSPYNHQVEYLRRLVGGHAGLEKYAGPVTVSTIDGFQGQERDIIYISMTRSNIEHHIGFLRDLRRMNVAITRARKKLVIVGDSSTLAADPFYDDLISYAQATGGYKSAWEFSYLM